MAGGRKRHQATGPEFMPRDVRSAPGEYGIELTMPGADRVPPCPLCHEPLTPRQRQRDIIDVGFATTGHLVCPLPEVIAPIVQRFAQEHGTRPSQLLEKLSQREPVRWHRAVESLFLGRGQAVADHLEVWCRQETE